jgi:hypothetical protein
MAAMVCCVLNAQSATRSAGETVQALRKPWIMMLSPFQKAKPGAQSAPDGAANLPAPQIGIEAGLVPSSSPAAPESAQRENAFL